MTPAEAIAALEAACPLRTYSARVQEWSYMHEDGTRSYGMECSVSVQPGIKKSCDLFKESDLRLCVAQAIASLPLTQTQRAIEQVAAGL